jgi:hypothetical protein
MLGKSFPSVARRLLPRPNPRKLALVALAFALAAAAAGCGGGGKTTATKLRVVDGNGFYFAAPRSWQVRRQARTVEARSGTQLVSVTTFTLPRAYTPSQWQKAVPELDRVAAKLAADEKATITSRETTQVAGGRARAYELDRGGVAERIAFVLHDRTEFQLYCRDAGDACDRLFSSFDFTQPLGATATISS